MEPLISICIPAFKANFFKEALFSALNQSYRNIEIIIVNDKSPDTRIVSIVQEITDSRIKYFENEVNLGGKNLVESWNKCLEYIEGEYFCFLCDDDLYEPNHLFNLVNLINRYPNVAVYKSKTNVIDKNANVLEQSPISPEFESGCDYLLNILKLKRRQTLSELLFNSRDFRTNGGFVDLPLAWGSDQLTCIRHGFKEGIVSSADATVLFRMSGQNISSFSFCREKEKFVAMLEFHRHINDILLPQIDDLLLQNIVRIENNKRREKVLEGYLVRLSIKDIFSFFNQRVELDLPKFIFFKSFIKHWFFLFYRMLKYRK